MTTYCSKCRKTCTDNDFYSKSDSWCKDCKKKYIKEYQRRNKERTLQSKRSYVKRNPDKVKESKDKYRETNREIINEKNRAYQKKNMKDVLARCREYQAKKANASPKWLNKQHKKEIKEFYRNCPADYEVDHILPLRGKSVSGLHVPWNLQYLKVSENRKKSNKVK